MDKPKALKEHCKFCFDVLVSALDKKDKPVWPVNLANYKLPIFVTWKIKDDLRGCIGTFSPDNINKILA
mgnify:CR=1 FL=1